MSKYHIKKNGYALMKNGEAVQVGQVLTCFRGETYTITGGNPPHKPSSQGKVWVTDDEDWSRELYPSVFECEWVEES